MTDDVGTSQALFQQRHPVTLVVLAYAVSFVMMPVLSGTPVGLPFDAVDVTARALMGTMLAIMALWTRENGAPVGDPA